MRWVDLWPQHRKAYIAYFTVETSTKKRYWLFTSHHWMSLLMQRLSTLRSSLQSTDSGRAKFTNKELGMSRVKHRGHGVHHTVLSSRASYIGTIRCLYRVKTRLFGIFRSPIGSTLLLSPVRTSEAELPAHVTYQGPWEIYTLWFALIAF